MYHPYTVLYISMTQTTTNILSMEMTFLCTCFMHLFAMVVAKRPELKRKEYTHTFDHRDAKMISVLFNFFSSFLFDLL